MPTKEIIMYFPLPTNGINLDKVKRLVPGTIWRVCSRDVLFCRKPDKQCRSIVGDIFLYLGNSTFYCLENNTAYQVKNINLEPNASMFHHHFKQMTQEMLASSP